MLDNKVLALAQAVNTRLKIAGKVLVTAESCTGGLIAAAITSEPGSSEILYGGFVTYANAAKEQMIGVPAETIEAHGAVSEPVARAMAEGARTASGADIAIAVTGIAGPGGESADKPIGLVHFGLAGAEGTVHRVMRYGDLGRARVREETVRTALEMVLEHLS